MRILLSLLFFALLSDALMAQNGEIVYHGNERIELRLETIKAGVDTMSIDGYRIQLFFGADMSQAEEEKTKFLTLYPDWSEQVYMPYTQPYWRVRIGNFYKQIDAQPMLAELSENFGNVFLVKDKIVRPPLPGPPYKGY